MGASYTGFFLRASNYFCVDAIFSVALAQKPCFYHATPRIDAALEQPMTRRGVAKMAIITQGRYAANIRPNGSGFLVIVTRDGDCLPGLPSRGYASEKAAHIGARKMIAKAAA